MSYEPEGTVYKDEEGAMIYVAPHNWKDGWCVLRRSYGTWGGKPMRHKALANQEGFEGQQAALDAFARERKWAVWGPGDTLPEKKPRKPRVRWNGDGTFTTITQTPPRPRELSLFEAGV